MKKRIRIFVLLASILISVSLIVILCYSWFSFDSNRGFTTVKEQLLFSYTEKIDMDELLVQDNEVLEVATRYSALYRNDNFRNMFVSSLPVRNYQNAEYSIINRDIVSLDENYITRNIDYNIIYGKDGILFGDEDNWLQINPSMVEKQKYDEHVVILGNEGEGMQYFCKDQNVIEMQPVYNGIAVKCSIKDVKNFSIPINFNRYSVKNDDAGYIVIGEYGSDLEDITSDKYFVISSALMYDENGNFVSVGKMKITTSKHNYNLKCNFNNTRNSSVEIVFFINYYCENMFFDCAVYEEKANNNHIFDSYIIYNLKGTGAETYDFLKFNLRSFTPKNSEYLDQILINLNVLHVSSNTQVEMYAVYHDWCSWTLNWENKPQYGEKIGEFEISLEGWYSIDITEYVKFLIENNYFSFENSSIMLKLKDNNAGTVVISSCDNSMYPPFFEVNYRVEE